MPKFNDSDNLPPRKLLPDGDYIYCVSGFDQSIQANGKTAGSDKYSLDLDIEGPNNTVQSVVMENLIDHELCNWKIDTFIKSAGIKLAKGQSFAFSREDAARNNVPWVNAIGLRGWLRLTSETSTKDPSKIYNKVATFYTDKQKLPPNAKMQAAANAAAAAVPFSTPPQVAPDEEKSPF